MGLAGTDYGSSETEQKGQHCSCKARDKSRASMRGTCSYEHELSASSA